jgi:hypothetical protein
MKSAIGQAYKYPLLVAGAAYTRANHKLYIISENIAIVNTNTTYTTSQFIALDLSVTSTKEFAISSF